MIRRLLIGIVIHLACLASIQASPLVSGFDPIVFNIGDASGNIGDIVCVDFTVENFVRAEGMSFSINYNSNILSVICPVDLENSPFTQTDLFFNCLDDDGRIRVLWGDPNISEGDGVTLADGTLMFTVCFELVGDCGLSSPITITDIPTPIEVQQISNDDMECISDELVVNEGTINILCETMVINISRCDTSPNASDGSISFFVAGGSGSYSYEVNPGNFTGTASESEIIYISPLAMDSYSITVTDNDTGEVVMDDVVVSENFALEVMLDVTDLYCWDRENGSIEATAIQGGFPVNATFEWSNFQFTQEISDLGNGSYSVTVTDIIGCTAVASADLFVDTLRVFAELIDSASCIGSDDAIVKIWAEGGTPFVDGTNPEYEYETSDDDAGPIDTFYLTTGAGTLTYMAVDAAVPYCGTDELEIEVPVRDVDYIMTVDSTNISCPGEDDGMVTITMTGGSNFSFQLRDDSNQLVPAAGSPTQLFAMNLTEGCYTILATDVAFGCEIRDTFCIIEPDPLVFVEEEVINPGCVGNDGAISLSTMGGTEPYTYVWSDGPADTEDRSNLEGGTYGVTVTDGGGCTQMLNFVLPDGSDVQIDATVVQAIECAQDMNAIIEVDVSTAGNWEYNWETADGTFVSDMMTVNGVGSGVYYVTATDVAASCMAIDTVVVAAASPIIIQGNTTEPTCAGTPNGIIAIEHIEGTAPFSYEWETGSMQQILSGVSEGTYNVTIADVNGCELDTFLTLTAPDPITVDVTDIDGVSCIMVADGSATATASGGPEGAGTYSYIWSSDPSTSDDGVSSMVNNLPAGENWVIAADFFCFSDTIFFTVADADSLFIDEDASTIVGPSCYQECDGFILVAAMGGSSGSYSYMWPDLGSNANVVNMLCAGSYDVIITDGDGCQQLRTIELEQPDSLVAQIDFSLTSEITCDVQNGIIGVDVMGGTAPYDYMWTDGVSDTNVASGLMEGSYFIDVTDDRGCTANTTYTLIAPEPVEAIIADIEEPGCFGELTCISIESATGGVGNNYTFTIDNGAFRYPLDSCVAVYANEYLITVFDSSGMCSWVENISIDQPAEIFVNLGPDQEINLGEDSELISPMINSETDITTGTWSPTDSLFCQDADCFDVIVSPLADQSYTFVVTDEFGCTAQDDIFISVNTRRNVFIPNIFTPNEDGNNDYFNIAIGSGATSVSYLYIYDRWGNLVYAVEDEYIPEETISTGWDGRYNGKYVNPGVYIYSARVTFIDGRTLDYSGDITVIR